MTVEQKMKGPESDRAGPGFPGPCLGLTFRAMMGGVRGSASRARFRPFLVLGGCGFLPLADVREKCPQKPQYLPTDPRLARGPSWG